MLHGFPQSEYKQTSKYETPFEKFENKNTWHLEFLNLNRAQSISQTLAAVNPHYKLTRHAAVLGVEHHDKVKRDGNSSHFIV